MSNTDNKEPESTPADLEIKLIDLNTFNEKNSHNNNQKSRTIRSKSEFAQKPLFLRRKPVMLISTFICFVIGVIILASLSNVFSFVNTILLHTNGELQVSNNKIIATPTVPQQDGLACTINAAWSPDSKLVAVLGYSNNCTLDHYQISLVNIYAVSTHKRLEQIHPDQAIISTFTKIHPDIKDKPVILYDHISWSPDSSKMLVPFLLSMPSNPAVPVISGILLIKKLGEQVVLLRLLPKENVPNVYFVWDLVRGINVQEHIVGPPLPSYLGFDLAPANAYYWKADGFLAAQNEQFRSQVSPVGNPIGGVFFTPWQSGQVISDPAANNGKGRYMWRTSFATWSPDGRYYTDIYTGAQLLPIGQSSSSQQRSNQIPTLIMHDQALEQLIYINAKAQQPFTLPIISWRPDGRVMAVYNNEHIDLYDSISGKRIQSLSPPNSTSIGLLQATDTLSWSPNGKYLLLSSSTWGVMTVWQLGQEEVTQ